MFRIKKIVLLCLLLLLVQSGLMAQDPNYILIDQSRGLPSNSVYNIYQDKRGFIWIASDAGLCRYDGYEFRQFNFPSASAPNGSEIQEDDYGRIWYETFDGYLFYVENDTMKTLKQNPPGDYWNYAIIGDTLYISQKNGVDVYDLKHVSRIRTIEHSMTLTSSTREAGKFFCVSADSIYYFNSSGKKKSVSNKTIHEKTIYGGLITSPEGEIFLVNRDNKEGKCFTVRGNEMNFGFAIPKGQYIQAANWANNLIWYCTPSGVFASDRNGNLLENGQVFFRSFSISCVMYDREGNYWISTKNQGILLVRDFNSRLYLSSLEPNRLIVNSDSLMTATITNEIWNISLNTMEKRLIHRGDGAYDIYHLFYEEPTKTLVFTGDEFQLIVNGKILRRGPGAVKSVARISPKYIAYAATNICGILMVEDTGPDPWDSLYLRNMTTGSLGANSAQLHTRIRGKSVVYDSVRRKIYYATNKGLLVQSPQESHEILYEDSSLYLNQIIQNNNIIYGIDARGKLCMINEKEEVTYPGAETGINENTFRLMRKSGNRIYLSTYDRVCMLEHGAQGDHLVFLQSARNEIRDFSIWNNKITIACPEGIIIREIKPETNPNLNIRFVLNNIQIGKTNYGTKSALYSKYDENDIEIHYSLLYFKSDVLPLLYYRINEGEWKRSEAESRILKLASLAPGNYRIQFMIGKPGPGSQPVSEINISILPPWWKTGWALSGFILIALLLLYFVYNFRMKIVDRRNKMETERILLENQLNHSLLTSIKSQMNPHFFYNALNTIQSFIYTNDKQNAGTYLSKFSKLTRMILEMSDKEQISLQEEVTALRLYLELEQARFENDFSFSIDFETIVNPEQTRLPSMIIQPYVENAVKHGLLHKKGEKKLSIRFAKANNVLTVTIDDNGIGRARSSELNALRKDKPKSFSSNANQKRLDLLNQGRTLPLTVHYTDKTDQNGVASGTTVILHIPV